MSPDHIQNILRKGEGLTVEFKKATTELPKNLFETVCAFLNRNGGTILLGVSDEGKVLGIEENTAEQLCKDLANLSNNPNKINPVFLLQPSVIEIDSKKIIHVFVPASSQVHKMGVKYYDRSVDGDYVVSTHAKISELYTRKSSQYSENTIYQHLYLSDFEDGIVSRVRKIIKIQRPDHPWNELDDNEFFKTAGLYRKDMASGSEGFTMTALLLFGRPEAIASAIPHYKIDALVRVKDIERYDDRINIRSNLVHAYDTLMQFVQKHLPDKFYLEKDQRISLRDIIFREVIVNLLIHREYSNAFPSSLVIYKDRVELKNANKPHLLGQMLLKDFVPFPKNPNIAQIFTQMGRSEELGTGIRKVYKYSKEYSGSDDIEFLEEDVFITKVPLGNIFTIKDNSDKVPDKVPDKITDNQTKLLELIRESPAISMSDLATKIGISKRKILDNINKLKQLGIVERIGPAKGGYWNIIK